MSDFSTPAPSAGIAAPGKAEPTGFLLVHLDQPRRGDHVRIGAMLSGDGWIIADDDITSVTLHLGERLLCYATYGLPSPEIAARFPHYPHSDHAGFSFSTHVASDLPAGDDAILTLRVHTAAGREASRAVAVQVHSAAPDAATALPRSVSELWPIRIALDGARLDGSGILRINGWAVSLMPLTDLQLFLDEQALGQPELDIERPDVAATYPHYPNAGVAGFRLVQDVGALPLGDATVRVVALSEGGIRRQIVMPVARSAAPHLVPVTDSDIHVCVDSFAVRADGTVAVEGWAVSAPGLASIAVGLDGAPVGMAELGRSRPDVGNRFPRIASARGAGFRFAGTVAAPLSGEHLLTVEVRNADGEERCVHLPLQVDPAGVTAAAVAADAADIRFEIDSPALSGDHATETVRGLLTIGGWAVAPEGIAEIEVALDGRMLGVAHTGIRRADIGAAFPDIPGAHLAGFAFTLPQRLVGAHTVRVGVRSEAGRTAERRFRVTGVTPEESTAGLTIRSRLTAAETGFALAVLDRLGPRPDICVVVRVGAMRGAALVRLHATLDSLVRQAYPAWHVVLLPSSGATKAPATDGAAPFAADPALAGRVRVATPGDGTLADLVAEDGATGPTLLTVLTAGDRLGADALLRYATEAALHPGATLVYGDERRFDPVLDAVQPHFKPDWSPELLLSTNYVGRAWCATGPLLRAAELPRSLLRPDHDYDLVLRLTEAAAHIAHVSALLLERDTADRAPGTGEKRALQAALKRRGVAAQVLPAAASGTWRVQRRLTRPGLVSIIMPTCAARGLVERAIATLRAHTAADAIEIICIDSIPADQPEQKAWLRAHADRVIATAAAFNWSLYNNLGAAAARGSYLLFLNDDIEVLADGWLAALLEHAQQPEIGLVGPQLLYPDGRVQHAGMFLAASVGRHAFRFAPADDPGPFGTALVQRNVAAVTGACMLMRRDVYDRLGGFDEAHSVVNNDLDFCLRVWAAGLRVVFTPYAQLTHHELASRARISDVFDEARFHGAWASRFLKGDPFFNAALSTDADDYAPQIEPIEVLHVGRPILARAAVRAILAVKVDHIGDFVMAFPALRRLKACFPNARLCVLGAKASGSLASLEPAIDEFIEFNFFHARSGVSGHVAGEDDLLALAARLRPYRFDVAIDLRMHGDTRHLLTRSGAAVLAGFEHQGRFPWLDVTMEWEGDRRLVAKRVHAGDRLRQLVETLAVACTEEPPVEPRPDPATARQALTALLARVLPDASPVPSDRKLVCIHPGVGSDMKQWPAASFAALIDLLVAEHDIGILLIGGGDEAGLADTVAATVNRPDALVSLIGRVPLGELPVVLRACCLFVGNDSGPKHLAASLGVPTLGIHSSNVDPSEWAPSGPASLAIRRRVACGPCYIASPTDCHRGLYCLRSIRPGDVFRACETLLRLDGANP